MKHEIAETDHERLAGVLHLRGSSSTSLVPILLRLDAQVHFGSVYSMVFGGDVGVTFSSTEGAMKLTRYHSGANDESTAPFTQSQAFPTVGAHASFLTFSFGPARQLTLSFTQGLMAYVPTSDRKATVTFEQTASLSYRF